MHLTFISMINRMEYAEQNLPNLYDYRSARRYVLDFLAVQQKQNRRFSIRGWSKAMGLKTHSLLVMMLQGKRKISEKQIPYLAKGLGLTPQDRRYFQALVQLENSETPEEKSVAENWIQDVTPSSTGGPVITDDFWVVSHWIHMAVLEITALKSFDGTFDSIEDRLSLQFSRLEILSAVERLLSVKLLKKNGDLLERTSIGVTTRPDVPSKAVRKYHQQVAQLAIDAIEIDPVTKREFQGLAISVKEDQIPVAKKMIIEFREKFGREMASPAGDEVYQMNLQFFRISDRRTEKKGKGA
jgi:uncharacterized protein (TIGR02147 family)